MNTITMETSTVYSSPVGDLLLTSDGASLIGLHFLDNDFQSSKNGLHCFTDSTSSSEIGQLSLHRLRKAGDWGPSVGVQQEVLANEVFSELITQLDEYFAGTRQRFELKMLSIRLDGTVFQRRVWNELCRIPYGQTISYGELAKRLGQPTASRAVGLANGRNPISIIVPCHRVIGANGKLVGYGGGLERKKKLLEIENAMRWED